jgi:hypothetical protein
MKFDELYDKKLEELGSMGGNSNPAMFGRTVAVVMDNTPQDLEEGQLSGGELRRIDDALERMSKAAQEIEFIWGQPFFYDNEGGYVDFKELIKEWQKSAKG